MIALNALYGISEDSSLVDRWNCAYLEDPKKMQPKIMTTTTVRISALRGSFSVG